MIFTLATLFCCLWFCASKFLMPYPDMPPAHVLNAEHYNQVQIGMTYVDIRRIMESNGEQKSQGQVVQGSFVEGRTWGNHETKTGISCVFVNDILVSKRQRSEPNGQIESWGQ